MKSIRSIVLLLALQMMILSNFAGCAASGHQAGIHTQDLEAFSLETTPESLVRLPEGSVVRVELATGEVLTGAFVSLSAGATAMDLKVNPDSELLAPEFVEEDHLYRIPLESITHLTLEEDTDQSKPNGVLMALGFFVLAFFVAAGLGAFQIAD